MGKIGAGGPPPKPTALKLLEGGRSHHKKNEQEPTPPTGNKKRAPRWMTRYAKKFWNRNYHRFQRWGILTEADVPAFELLCETVAEYYECYDIIKKEGYTFTTPNGYHQQRPEVAIKRKARTDMENMLLQFGCTPASRTRVKRAFTEFKDEFDDLLD
jgi:P27 family predicted phage terminase small subunit